MLAGELPHQVRDIHELYGKVVRVAPDELSFTDPTAWKDIYTKGFPRPYQYRNKPPGKTAENLISASESDHTRFRKVLNPAFSLKSEHESAIKSSVDLLMVKLHWALEHDASGEATVVDLLKWFNLTTFDIIGTLVWSSSFGCLEGMQYHPWIQVIAQFKTALIAVATKFYPPLHTVLTLLPPKSAMADLTQISQTTRGKISQRLVTGGKRTDMISYMAATSEASSSPLQAELKMSRAEIEINSILIVVAGSESVTTVLTGTINYLLRDQGKLGALTREVRSMFPREADINGASLIRLPYLNAILQEGLRLCPTIPDGMRRQVPKGGAVVAGCWLPENTVVSVSQWATYQSSGNFSSPKAFAPERWLEDSKQSSYISDKKEAFQPFSLGPHNCPGRSLAYLEMRLILARLVWNFNLETPSAMELPRWEKQKIYWFWEKQPTSVSISKAVQTYPYPALSLILRLVLVSHVTRPAIQPENSNI